jgi:hypothetical protein
MSQQPDLELLPREDGIILAIQAMKCNKELSQRRAATIYNVPESTLRTRRAKTTSRRDSHPNSSKLLRSEEEVLVQCIRRLDARGFAPTLSYIQEMANQLLAARGSNQVGEKWARNFVRRKPEIKSQISRPRDHRRVLCSNPAVISPWFDLVRNVKAKYGILDEDTYNFDETGFQVGVGGSVKVVTASERRLKPLSIQPGDREWITLIACINAMGWSIPPFFILKAKHHDKAWYHKNGWTTNDLGLAWLKHFIQHTEARTVGSHRLLIIDGHESHKLLEFQNLCEESKIIALCMPPHASHILQPLDVGCFAPLKQAYRTEIRGLADSHINHVDKKAFLATFLAVYEKAVSKSNILLSFRATGLVPLDLEVVLSKLEVKPRTPTPPLPGPTSWQPKTPSNAVEIDSQTTLIIKRIRDHKSSSPDSIIEMILQVKKGSTLKDHSHTLLEARVATLEAANNAASERKKRKKKRIQEGGTLSQAEAEEIIRQRDAEAEAEAERVQAGGSSKGVRRCKTCGKAGHNKRTCKKDTVEADD